ncbi:MAG: hydB, partial [Deltaproteobacteria bacterium]|nr:hydB [Deltaproteobacteria bacterium]
ALVHDHHPPRSHHRSQGLEGGIVHGNIHFIFRDEYEAHILENRCPAGACQGLKYFRIDTDLCVGCMACKKKCPSGAIVGERKKAHYIVKDQCLGCGACKENCPQNAIFEVR